MNNILVFLCSYFYESCIIVVLWLLRIGNVKINEINPLACRRQARVGPQLQSTLQQRVLYGMSTAPRVRSREYSASCQPIQNTY